jgi:phage terminase small subunit
MRPHLKYGKMSVPELVEHYRFMLQGRKTPRGSDIVHMRAELARRKGVLENPSQRKIWAFGGLTPMQEKFCLEYMRTGDPEEAYKKAGYKSRHLKPAVKRMLVHPLIQLRLEEIREQALKDIKVNAEKVIDKILEVYDSAMSESDYTNANRAMESIGKHLGMFVDRSEQQVTQLTKGDEPETVKKDIYRLAEVIGLKVVPGGK